MDGLLYYAVLVMLAVFAFVLNQNHNSKLALLTVLIGVYIIYSHTTGHTVTEYKNSMVESLDKSANELAEDYKTKGFDETQAQESVK